MRSGSLIGKAVKNFITLYKVFEFPEHLKLHNLFLVFKTIFKGDGFQKDLE